MRSFSRLQTVPHVTVWSRNWRIVVKINCCVNDSLELLFLPFDYVFLLLQLHLLLLDAVLHLLNPFMLYFVHFLNLRVISDCSVLFKGDVDVFVEGPSWFLLECWGRLFINLVVKHCHFIALVWTVIPCPWNCHVNWLGVYFYILRWMVLRHRKMLWHGNIQFNLL